MKMKRTLQGRTATPLVATSSCTFSFTHLSISSLVSPSLTCHSHLVRVSCGARIKVRRDVAFPSRIPNCQAEPFHWQPQLMRYIKSCGQEQQKRKQQRSVGLYRYGRSHVDLRPNPIKRDPAEAEFRVRKTGRRAGTIERCFQWQKTGCTERENIFVSAECCYLARRMKTSVLPSFCAALLCYSATNNFVAYFGRVTLFAIIAVFRCYCCVQSQRCFP